MSAFQMELDAAVHLVHEALADIDELLRLVDQRDGDGELTGNAYPLEDVELANALICRAILADGSLQLVRDRLDTIIGERLGTYETVVEGVGVVRRHTKKSRTSWDRPHLLKDVLDSRLFERDGTMRDESPLEKVVSVWNLGAPRLTALKERGLDAEDYCDTEIRSGWNLEVL